MIKEDKKVILSSYLFLFIIIIFYLFTNFFMGLTIYLTFGLSIFLGRCIEQKREKWEDVEFKDTLFIITWGVKIPREIFKLP